MSKLADLISSNQTVTAHGPWPGIDVDAAAWRLASEALGQQEWTLIGLWGEPDRVHMTVMEPATQAIAVLTLPCPDGCFPSVGLHHSPAIRLERAVHDLYGLRPTGAEDTRPWLDHGAWGVGSPLAAEPTAPPKHRYKFLPVIGDNLHQIPVGPVHAGIIEPGHFRFTADGETIVRLEQRLGYTHKGTESLLRGADLEHGARLAGRLSGDSTVAYALGFALAVEAALEVVPPPRAVVLRGLMAELERVANHIGDFGAICNDASFAIMHAHCGILRERILRASHACFGHRLMMDRIVPGGVVSDLAPGGAKQLQDMVADVRTRLAQLTDLYANSSSLLERTVTTGFVSRVLVERYGAGGFVGRASGRGFDCRRWPGYAPYDRLRFDVPVLQEGDVNARVWLRLHEIRESLSMLEQLVATIPHGPVRVMFDPATPGGKEALALVESFRGDVFVWLRIDPDGRLSHAHFRDPSWFQWPLLEVAVHGNIVADFPLCNKSFNCSYSGHDC